MQVRACHALLVFSLQSRATGPATSQPRVELLGVVMTMFDGRTRLSQQVLSEVREHFGEKVDRKSVV